MEKPNKKIPDFSHIPLAFIYFSRTDKVWDAVEYKDVANCWSDYDDYKNAKPCAILNFGQYIVKNF